MSTDSDEERKRYGASSPATAEKETSTVAFHHDTLRNGDARARPPESTGSSRLRWIWGARAEIFGLLMTLGLIGQPVMTWQLKAVAEKIEGKIAVLDARVTAQGHELELIQSRLTGFDKKLDTLIEATKPKPNGKPVAALKHRRGFPSGSGG